MFGHIRRAKHLTVAFVGYVPAVTNEECGGLLGGVSVIVSQNMRIGLQEESNIGVADPLADHLRAYASFERTGRVWVPQIVEGDPRESCRHCHVGECGRPGRIRGVTTATPSYKGHRYPVEIINHCVWLYFRFPLSFREVDELMLVRGVAVSR